ncbi:hypothetical protein RB614_17170 [Phytohabitans sp. ZYX-F-186]|uniref:GNAT family N-acetyltransferase n=1 Tax=Phytohabitans maris TaxID=3071409 RepID=A0ABU0ZI91_9ACTN|nr:hypothetical protein [Phytohabitans sp. ZYX-F-186]MDQ7906246.1 hypothetical protein [Phytohabitans sp. ZYX-F-186]
MEKIEIRRVGYLDPDARALVEAALDDLRERYGDGEGDGTPIDPTPAGKPA